MKSDNQFQFNNIFAVGRGVQLDGEEFLEDMKGVFKKHGVNSISGGYSRIEEGDFVMRGVDLDISDKKRMREHPPVNIK